MDRKNLLYILPLGLLIYLYIILTTADTESSEANSKLINEEPILTTSPPPSKDKVVIEPELTKQSHCSQLDKAHEIYLHNKIEFISAKAVQWYFDGYDRYEIAETLAAMFGYSAAMKWIITINQFSLYHEQYNALTQNIDSLSYHSDFSKHSHYLTGLSRYQYTHGDHAQPLDQPLNQLPDIAMYHWSEALNNALQDKDIDGAITAIYKLKALVTNPTFFPHPIKSSMLYPSLSFLSQPQVTQIITALLELSPIYVDSKDHHEKHYGVMLANLGLEKTLWRFTKINSNDFKIDPVITVLIEQLSSAYPSLNRPPIAKNICENQIINNDIPLNVAPLTVKNSTQPLTPIWQGAHSLFCPKQTFMSKFGSVNNHLKRFNLSLDDFNTYQALQKNSGELKDVLDQLDESQRASLLELIYLNKQLSPSEIDVLFNKNITPTDSNFYLLVRRLPIDQQKDILLKYQHRLDNFDYRQISLITNAITYNNNDSDELVSFLISHGFALKPSASAPDPLWLQLHLLQIEKTHQALPKKALQSLIEHTQLDEIHVNIMYKIKQSNIELYNTLVNEFPKLLLNAPQFLMNIQCES
ncbi:hypothetical protein CWB96_09660 [Pseudoalteromonas citrea]|uniref:Uncharacterized protein n=1 Tax=Pseudoalteromonas citrea TaxID=43655 RepID=A0A5S3XPT8_9GAMM|nr:hypothetical protein [Pseudoalteromonas citrea]TMP38848.1 hypothetical protein CWB97_21385 [Pseudoalteromonas citrea]TMP59376.1 hypothetical protein CWB96_09660 [Pseudoalteromonas citrea]